MLKVHVSIHDVSPACPEQVEIAIQCCTQFGAQPSLLVIPNYHGRYALQDHPEFCVRLRELRARGHEIHLHGLQHQSRPWRVAPPQFGRPDRLAWLYAQRIVSGGEAEFSDFGRREASQALDEGMRILRATGLEPLGFVPPAWSMPSWLLGVLAARGFRYTEDHLRVYDPMSGTQRTTALINWATRSRLRRWSTVVFGRLIADLSQRVPVRIAIHPQDLSHPALRSEITRLLARAEGHFVTSGRELLATNKA